MIDDATARVLAALEVFRRRVFPGFLRRMAHWKGLDTARRSDVIDDVFQDLVVDALQEPEAILALPESERHARWLARAQRSHYRIALRDDRVREAESSLDEIPIEPSQPVEALEDSGVAALSDEDRVLLERVSRSGTRLKNGRLCTTRTARACQVSNRRLRELWLRTAEVCGFDDDYERYWRRRLGEALLQLAAIRLVTEGELRTFDDRRRALGSAERTLNRVRRIRKALEARPLDAELRTILQRVAPARSDRRVDPPVRALLEDARRLNPEDPAIPLWQFEAAIADGDLRSAAESLRTARELGADRVRTGLARARLLECRHRRLAARRLLNRLQSDFPRDRRPRSSLEGLERQRPRARKFAPSQREIDRLSHGSRPDGQRSSSPSSDSRRSTNRRSPA